MLDRTLVLALCLPLALTAQGGDPLWSVQPLQQVTPPAVADAAWDAHPIDRFVFARLQQAGLSPAPLADPRTLVRRAWFDLVGLPPPADAVERFAADPSDAAFAAMIDELLASPHYGERQARHWLDLARYADSNGLDENLAYGTAWQYRDWVVRALNQDLPYDRFASLQIAGDLLADPHDRAAVSDGLLATGFLALGPKMLAEQDKEKLQLDVVDEQLDLFGRTFLGLTLGCARCHDHKFDPVSAADYYALAGIFRSTKSLATLDHVSKWFEAEQATPAERELRRQRVAAAEQGKQQLAQHEQQATAAARKRLAQDVARYLLAGQEATASLQVVEAESAASTSLRRDNRQWGSADCVILHTGRQGPQFATWTIERESAGAVTLAVRYASKESRPMRVLVNGAVQHERALEAVTGDWHPPAQRWFTVGDLQLQAGRNELRLEGLASSVPHLDKLALTPAAPWPGEHGWAAGLLPRAVRNVALMLTGSQHEVLAIWRELAARGGEDFAAVAATMQGRGGAADALIGSLPPETPRELAARYQTLLNSTEAGQQLLFGEQGLFALPLDELLPALPPEQTAAIAELRARAQAAAAAVPPMPAMAICVGEGEPRDLPVHIRGSHLSLAATPTPRGFLSVLRGLVPDQPIAQGSGRRELAAWLFDARNPLPGRVMANRIWQHHFGHGLSRSPSNFGRRGEVPSHPELLDWLAAEFRTRGWSIKAMHRVILTSRTWRQQSRGDAAAAAVIDPDNRLLWRQHRRRLEAETLRDAMLQVAGTLDPTLGGTLLATGNRDYVTNDQSNNQAQYAAPRRSLYLPVIRNAMYDWFAAFDYVDSSVHLEQRPSSAVAQQALMLLNSPLVMQAAADLAARAAAAAADVDERIDWLYRTALARAPSATERDRARQFLTGAQAAVADDGSRTLRALAQVLLAGNEFSFVD